MGNRFRVLPAVKDGEIVSWCIWDDPDDHLADGYYFQEELAQHICDVANAMLREGRDPYVDWGWAESWPELSQSDAFLTPV